MNSTIGCYCDTSRESHSLSPRVPIVNGARFWTLSLALAAMTVLAYHSLWQNEFVDFDDEHLITTNDHVIRGLTAEGIDWSWTNHEAPYWMPITWLSFQLDACLLNDSSTSQSHLNPMAFHGQNLFWHICNVQLLFALILRLTGMTGRSFLVAAIFAVHPMHVESIAWASERKDVLMCFFGLSSIWCYVHYANSKSWWSYAGMLITYQASLMSKPMLLTLPFILLLLDYWPLGRLRSHTTQQQPLRSLILEKIPMFLVALTIAGHTMATRPGNPMPDLGIFDRSMNALSGYACYLARTFYPHHLAVLYLHPGSNCSLLQVCCGAGLLILCSALAVRRARDWRWLPVGWFWFVGTLLPVIGLTQGGHQAWADRFSYWPHIGLLIAVVWGVSELAERLRVSALLRIGICTSVLGVLMSLTSIQVGYWRNSTTLWEHAIAVTEHNDRAHQHLSICYRRQGCLSDAEYHLHEATRI